MKLLKHFTIGIDVLFIFLLLFNYLGYLPEFWNMTYIFFFVLIVNTIFFTFKIKEIPEGKRKDSKMIYYFSHFFLLGLVIIVLNQFLKRQIMIDFMPEITGVIIALGFLTFYANRNRVEKEIEDEKVEEEKKEEKRYDEFGKKFPFWDRIPLVRRFVRWMYKEGWWYSVGLILIVVFGFILRVWKISHIGIINDEIFQVLAFKSLSSYYVPFVGESLYLRGILISYLAYFFNYVGFSEIISIRLPSIIFGTLIIPLVYFISKRICSNKFFSLMIASFISVELMIIQFSRLSRFYIPVSFFMLLLIYFDIRKKPKKSFLTIILSIIFLLFLSEFVFAIIILFAFIVSKIFVNRNFFKNKTFLFVLISLILFLAIFFIYMYFFQYMHLLNMISFNSNLTLLKAYLHWILDNYFLFFIFLFLGTIFALVDKNVKNKFFFIFSGVLFAMLALTNLTNYNYTIRTFVPLIPLIFISSSYGFRYFSILLSKKFIYILLIFIFLIFFVESVTYLPTEYGDFYHPRKVIYEKAPIVLDWETPSIFIRENYQSGDVLISHALNPYFLYYYSQIEPNISARYLGSSRIIDGKAYDQNKDIEVIHNINIFRDYISNNLDEGHRIFIFSSGTTWPIENEFYKTYFNQPIKLEAPSSFYKFLSENEDKLVYTGEDGMTKVYLFE